MVLAFFFHDPSTKKVSKGSDMIKKDKKFLAE